ncbi:hypothetical protein [Streptomyces monashensis]|uniref:hypothetical protein n=1 Tax=Streptomyces monashensis TaxID=1678012 RepID=UPI0015A608C7|nr:hypothetical protein [Streptomyces monashensis]
MSVRLARLAQAGLIESVAVADGRSKPVRLTPRGRDRRRAATEQRTAREHDLFADALSPEDIEKLNALLGRLLGRLEDEFGRATRHDVPKDA